MSEKQIPVRTALMPAYYKDFHCIMGACQDNCCDDGWRIEFSKKDYLAVKRAARSDELKQMVEQSLGRLNERAHGKMYAEFHQSEEGRCAFHTPEGLCRLQLECGEGVLPNVCRTYPRGTIYTSAALEYALSPSCEGVLALLWDLKDGVDFIEEPLPKEKHRIYWTKNPMEARFSVVRALWIDALQARALPLSRRFLLLGLMSQQLMGLDWQDASTLDHALLQWQVLLQNPDSLVKSLEKMPGNQQMFISNNVYLLFKLLKALGSELVAELLSAATGETSLEALNLSRISANTEYYQNLENKLDEFLNHSEHFLENLMVSIVFQMVLPSLDTPQDLWKSYVELCNLYSFYRFSAVCSMDKEVSRARLFHAVVRASRALVHDQSQRIKLQDELFKNDSATLAHMAILVGG
ncbi:hypothetical protein D1646_00775 [Pseudoflavonifractor sp. 60]|uniref:flagellin lysine-N-methylase n=1 Tax=Pseudoflavonifractor sp. 60 TaxID=2304576 RepID=UPI0013687748|nr:flagellin lysine-N-methylase [Pseudoflavonifractor sp. 60]NBI65363.1 hypothetical protein [Pseudoflavonifractor sp. 60]